MNSGFVWKTLSQGNKVEEEYKRISNDTYVLQVHMYAWTHTFTHTHVRTHTHKENHTDMDMLTVM